MSRKRREFRESFRQLAKHEGRDMNGNGNGVLIAPPEPKKEHKFTFNTPQGPHSFAVPAEEMKCCPCGCDLFRTTYKLCFIKPVGVMGAEPVCCRVEVYLCEECGKEIGSNGPSVKDVAANKIVVTDVME